MEDTTSHEKRPVRKRVSKACDWCRSRKDRCDGKSPSCSTCAKLGRKCAYTSESKKRGLPEGYVRGLEKLCALAIRNVNGFEDTLVALLKNRQQENSLDSFEDLWADEGEHETLLDTWKNSQILHELENVLHSFENLPSKRVKKEPGRKHTRMSSTASAVVDDIPKATNQFEDNAVQLKPNDDLSSGLAILTKRPEDGIFDAQQVPIALPGKSLGERLGRMQPPSHAWTLLDIHFTYTQNWFPILERGELLRVLYQESHSTTSTPGERACLWAALASGSVQHTALQRAIPNITEPLDSEGTLFEDLCSHARHLTFVDTRELETGHVQALLLLTLTNIGLHKWEEAWFLAGQAVRAAVILGLGTSPYTESGAGHTPSKDRRKHIFLGCFVLDTITSSKLGWTPHVRNEDIENVGVLDESGLEEWDPWRDTSSIMKAESRAAQGPSFALSTFNRLVQLLKHLNQLASDKSKGSDRAALCQKLHRELEAWDATQSPMFQISAVSEGPILPHLYNLRLTQIAVQLAILLDSRSTFEFFENETFSTSLLVSMRQVIILLEQQVKVFDTLLVPATYGLYADLICQGYKAVNEDGTGGAISTGMRSTILDAFGRISKIWPQFSSMTTLMLQSTSNVGALDEFFSTNTAMAQDPLFPRPQVTPASNIPVPWDFAMNPNNGGIPRQPSQSTTHALMSSGSPFDHAAQPDVFGQTPNSGADGSNLLLDQVPPNISSTSAPASIESPAGSRAARHHGSSFSDTDSIFHDFATLDAMEWTNNWEQSLAHLGFAGAEGMDQEFQNLWSTT